MVLIGVRKCENKYYFLLQNWLEKKYFIEVSAEYMHHCGAQITFITKKISMRKNDLVHLIYNSPYGETNLDTAEDTAER